MEKYVIPIILLVIVVVVVFAIGKSRKTAESSKITAALVGEKLSDIFINSWKSPNDIRKLRNEFSLKATNTETYLCLSSLYFMSFIRVTQSEDINIPYSIIEKISHSLASFLVAKYIVLHKVNDDVDSLLQKQNAITQRLINFWDKNINNKPSPHWYVGKEVCFILNGKDITPNPALITVLSDFLSNDTIAIKNFLKEFKEKFTIVE